MPQILMEEDLHAPGAPTGPASTPRRGLPGHQPLRLLGRGHDYAWSATSAGQDIIDTFAVKLCEPDGCKPTIDSTHYLTRASACRWRCSTRTNAWTPNAGRPDARRARETLPRRAHRSSGSSTGAARSTASRYAFTKLRATYFHEVDSARRVRGLQQPERKCTTPQDFKRAASKINYTFNWFYIDDKHIAYFNSGDNPVRAQARRPGPPDLRARAKYTGRAANPNDQTRARRTPPLAEHPQVIDQRYLTSWNNKQARGLPRRGRQLLLRADLPLADARRADQASGSRAKSKMSLPELIDAMEDAGTVDLRGDAVAALALKVIGKPERPAAAPARSTTLQRLGHPARTGATATTTAPTTQAEAVRIMDAWWPRWVRGRVPARRSAAPLYRGIDEHPADSTTRRTTTARTSAPPTGRLVRLRQRTCARCSATGRGPLLARSTAAAASLARCRKALRSSLQGRAGGPDARALRHDRVCTRTGDQMVLRRGPPRAVGGATQPPIHWINRPTFQQAVEIQAQRAALSRPAGVPLAGDRSPRPSSPATTTATPLTRSVCSRSSSTRARGSSERLDVAQGEIAVVLHGSPAQLDAAQPWLPVSAG